MFWPSSDPRTYSFAETTTASYKNHSVCAFPLKANNVKSPGSSKPNTVTFFELPSWNMTSLVIEYLPVQFS